MASNYQPKVWKANGGNSLNVDGHDGGSIRGTASAGATPAQASHIADVSVATIAWTTGDKAKINTLLGALEDCGILATS